MGKLIMLLCAGAAIAVGFSHFEFYVIPIIGAVWSVGSTLFHGNILSATEGRPFGYAVRIWMFNTIQSAVFYAIGYGVSQLFR